MPVSIHHNGILAASRRFPSKRDEIEALAKSNESFCDMCDELAEAELALARVDLLSETIQAQRRLEWQRFIGETLTEIEAQLRASNVVPLGRAGNRLS